jgi:hypothetical protein
MGDEGQEWRWYVASINGFGDAIFEASADLALGEIPHVIRFRKFSSLQAAQAGGTGRMIPKPVPWLPIGVGAVEADEEGLLSSTCVQMIVSASKQVARAMNEIYQDAGKRKSDLTIVEGGTARNFKG